MADHRVVTGVAIVTTEWYYQPYVIENIFVLLTLLTAKYFLCFHPNVKYRHLYIFNQSISMKPRLSLMCMRVDMRYTYTYTYVCISTSMMWVEKWTGQSFLRKTHSHLRVSVHSIEKLSMSFMNSLPLRLLFYRVQPRSHFGPHTIFEIHPLDLYESCGQECIRHGKSWPTQIRALAKVSRLQLIKEVSKLLYSTLNQTLIGRLGFQLEFVEILRIDIHVAYDPEITSSTHVGGGVVGRFMNCCWCGWHWPMRLGVDPAEHRVTFPSFSLCLTKSGMLGVFAAQVIQNCWAEMS